MKILLALHALSNPISSRQSDAGSELGAERDSSSGSASRANVYYIVAGICTGLMTLAVFLRLYIRLRVTRNPWWDDVAVMIALLSQSAYTGVVWRAGSVGLGAHLTDVSAQDLTRFSQLSHPSAILTAPAIYFTKLALLLLYLRLFSQNRLVKLGIWAGILVCTVFYTIVMFLYIFTEPDAQLKVTYAVAATGVITDVYIICLPLLAIAQLHLNRGKKWRVAAVFLTGVLAVVMSFLGCIYRFQLDVTDSTYSLLDIYTVKYVIPAVISFTPIIRYLLAKPRYSTVEVDIGIICCCLPLTAALFKKANEESWWLTTYRSLRGALMPNSRGSGSRLGSNGSHGSRQTNASSRSKAGYRQFPNSNSNVHAEGKDDIPLVDLQSSAKVTASAEAHANEHLDDIKQQQQTRGDERSRGWQAGGGTDGGSNGIWQQTRIQQHWNPA